MASRSTQRHERELRERERREAWGNAETEMSEVSTRKGGYRTHCIWMGSFVFILWNSVKNFGRKKNPPFFFFFFFYSLYPGVWLVC